MLHEIVEYGRRKGILLEPGFKPVSIQWLVILGKGGQCNVLEGRRFPKCPDLSQSEMKALGTLERSEAQLNDADMFKIMPQGFCGRHFLWDEAGVVALVTKDAAPELELSAKHHSFVHRLRQAAEAYEPAKMVADALEDEKTLANLRKILMETKAKPNDKISFAVSRPGDEPPLILLDDPSWHVWWNQFRAEIARGKAVKRSKKSGGPRRMLSILSGKEIGPCLTHPAIEGLRDVGGHAKGDQLVSFKQPSFGSYGLSQAENAAMSEEEAQEYRIALNDLIENQSRKLAGSKVVYWYVGDRLPEKEDDVFAQLVGMDFGGAEVEENRESENTNSKVVEAQATSRAGQLLDAICSGQRPELRNCQYRALTLSGNAGRVVVRDWMQGQFDELVKNVAAWFEDLRLMNLGGVDPIYSPNLEQLATCFLPPRGKTQKYPDWVKPVGNAREALWQCAVRDPQSPIPASLAGRAALAHNTHILNHRFIATNRDSSHRESQDKTYQPSLLYTRMALLKAYLNRYARAQKQGDYQVFPSLNVNHPRAAYQCGRLMAVLEMIQTEAQGEVGATIAQTHYATASARPIVALPRLETLTQHHLPKIKPPRLRNEYQRLLTEINGRIENTIPRTFDLEDQCLFHLGYYHQRGFQPYAEPPQRHKTMNGELVRSKSEVIVANLLHLLGFKYEYEAELKINDHILLHPDFTIREKDNRFGKPVYIEHLGMMDNFTYRADWEDRQKLLMSAGILPLTEGGGKNGILVTTEEKNGTINCEELAKTLKEIKG